jgi:mannitol-specific phosphotransferase system IIBC component
MEALQTKVTTAGGVLIILLANINSGDILKTVLLAMTGAVVSFLMSLLIKKIGQWIRDRKG